MLRQILRDLWVEPELLAELDEEQRLALFCHMRAEQVRRWAEREKEEALAPPGPPAAPLAPRPGAKRVDWLLGADGQPWVWVMGEHPDDVPSQDAHQGAGGEQETAHSEGEEEGEGEALVQVQQQQTEVQVDQVDGLMQCGEEEGLYCSADEVRRGALQEISLNRRRTPTPTAAAPAPGTNARAPQPPERPDKVWQRVALWERRVAEERGVPLRRRKPSSDPLHPQQQQQRRATPDEQQEELAWREQERRAKEAEQQIREIARRAREEHRRSSHITSTILPAAPPPPRGAANDRNDSLNNNLTGSSSSCSSLSTAKPPSAEAVVEWFRSSEVARGAGLAPGAALVAPWFHGLISRQEAERRLAAEAAEEGSFLVRLSERVWGYAISLKARHRCKHFLVDAASGQYQFLGAHQNAHASLGELVDFHSRHPITLVGGERLLHPCAHSEVPSIFQGLLTPTVPR